MRSCFPDSIFKLPKPILSRQPPAATAPAPAAAKETMEQKMLREKYDLIQNAPENSKSIQIIHY
jgi:hypothetical protein